MVNKDEYNYIKLFQCRTVTSFQLV